MNERVHVARSGFKEGCERAGWSHPATVHTQPGSQPWLPGFKWVYFSILIPQALGVSALDSQGMG